MDFAFKPSNVTVFQYLVHDALEAEGLGDLDGRHGVPHVHLVGEEEYGDLARPDVGVLRFFLISCEQSYQKHTKEGL